MMTIEILENITNRGTMEEQIIIFLTLTEIGHGSLK